MLILSRKVGETVVIDGNIKVTIKRVSGKTVCLEFDAPKPIPIWRKELLERLGGETRKDNS